MNLKIEKITDVQFIQNQCKKAILKQTKVMLVSNYEFRLNAIVFIVHEWSRPPANNNEMVKITDV